MNKSRQRASNPRPADYKSAALPTVLCRQIAIFFEMKVAILIRFRFVNLIIKRPGSQRYSVTKADLHLWFTPARRLYSSQL